MRRRSPGHRERSCLKRKEKPHAPNQRGENQALQGQSQSVDSFAGRLWGRMTRKLPHFWVRIWHLDTHNQILGVGARGLRPLNESLLEEICLNYEMA